MNAQVNSIDPGFPTPQGPALPAPGSALGGPPGAPAPSRLQSTMVSQAYSSRRSPGSSS